MDAPLILTMVPRVFSPAVRPKNTCWPTVKLMGASFKRWLFPLTSGIHPLVLTWTTILGGFAFLPPIGMPTGPSGSNKV